MSPSTGLNLRNCSEWERGPQRTEYLLQHPHQDLVPVLSPQFQDEDTEGKVALWEARGRGMGGRERGNKILELFKDVDYYGLSVRHA